MSIKFDCPHCHASMNVGDQFAGTQGPCRSCGQPIAIPGDSKIITGQPVPAGPPATRSSGAIPIIAILAGCLLMTVCGVGLLVALLLPAVQAAREAARRVACTNNQRQVALALLNYEAVHGELPPAYVADDEGTPMHSWRVLILPFLDQSGIHDQYNFEEPWDSPGNMAVTQQIPGVYQCPSDTGLPTLTSYFVISDPESLFPGDQSRKLSEVSDGTSNTVMVVEAAGIGVHWADPRDLSVDELETIISEHPGVINITMADGSVRSVTAVERAMVTAAAGD